MDGSRFDTSYLLNFASAFASVFASASWDLWTMVCLDCGLWVGPPVVYGWFLFHPQWHSSTLVDKTSTFEGSNYYCLCAVCAGDVLRDSSLLPGPVQRDAKYNVLSLIKGNKLVKKVDAHRS